MTTLTTTRPVTRKVTEEVQASMEVTMRQTRKGGVEISINGEKALALTSTGYLRRFPVSAAVGMRRNKDGKVAFKRATSGATAGQDSNDGFLA